MADISVPPPDFSALFEEKGVVMLLRGKNNFGDLIYSYVKVAVSKIDKLHHAIQNKLPFSASDFGEVVAAGTGEPSDELKAEIAAQYPMLNEQEAAKTVAMSPNIDSAITHPPIAEKKWDEY